MFKKIAIPIFFLAFFLLIPIKAQAQYLCGGTGLVYSDPVFCQYACGASCEQLNSTTVGESGACDTTNYEGFVYDANTGFTYAMSVAKNFWTNWTNLATIQNSTDNTALNQTMAYYSVSNAWIGAYDPSMSSAYNTLDPQNYTWQSNGASVSSGYNNWASGQPNNAFYQQDIGVVSSNLYGEHWAEMKSNGTWNDEGYHYNFPASQNYAPYYNALVQWNGPLSCVDGTVPPSTSTGGTQQQLTSTYCNNTTPCYLCTNGTNINECLSGTDTSGSSSELCPYSQTACTQQTATPGCPGGYTWNGSTCEETTYSCPSGGTLSGTTCTYNATATETCPSGYTYNSSTGECTETTGATASGSGGTQGLSSLRYGDELTGVNASGDTITFYYVNTGNNYNGSFNITLSGATASGFGGTHGLNILGYGDELTGLYASGDTITFYYVNFNSRKNYNGSFNMTLSGATASGSGGTHGLNILGYGDELTGLYASGDTITFYYVNFNSRKNYNGSFNMTLSGGATQTTSPTIVYSCSSGGTLSGTTCTYSATGITQTATPTCPSGYTLSGSYTLLSGYSNVVDATDADYAQYTTVPDSNAQWVTLYNGIWTAPGSWYIAGNFTSSSAVTAKLYSQTDNQIKGIWINGSPVSFSDNGYWPDLNTNSINIPQGQDTIEIEIYNAGTTPNPTAIDFSLQSNGNVLIDSTTNLIYSTSYITPVTSNSECVTYTCPLGSTPQGQAPGQNYTCVEPSGSSTYYCSPDTCNNTQTGETVTNPAPVPAQTNNGTVTNTGCVGQVYIFSGQPYFCKPPGLQTGGTNCCQSTKDWFGLGSCDSQEQKLAQLRSDYECNQVGTYCSESFLGVCLQTMQSWCCFGGELAELIQVQVKGGNTGSVGVNWGPSGPGGTQSWVAGQGFGSADSPNCGGFTPTQFQKVDFSQVNLTPFYQNISTSAAANTTGAVNSAETKFQNEVSGANP